MTATEIKRDVNISRKAQACWTGDVKSGKGTISLESNSLKDVEYSFSSRIENGKGTNPEELLASSHAGCFTMQLSALLSKAGFTPKELNTDAVCEVIKENEGFKVDSIKLSIIGSVDGINESEFKKYVSEAAKICPISRAIENNVVISYDVKLK